MQPTMFDAPPLLIVTHQQVVVGPVIHLLQLALLVVQEVLMLPLPPLLVATASTPLKTTLTDLPESIRLITITSRVPTLPVPIVLPHLTVHTALMMQST